MNKEIFFLNRAYNDMDTQASLMHAFAKSGEYKVRIIGIPVDGYVGNPDLHEAAKFLCSFSNVSFENVLNMPLTPDGLRLLYRVDKACHYLKKKPAAKNKILSFILRGLHVATLKTISFWLRRDSAWLMDTAKNWCPDIVVLDEIGCQPDRSLIVDRILPMLKQKGSRIFIIQTGQYIYTKPFESSGIPKYKKSCAERCFLPSRLDESVFNKHFYDEKTEVLGNLRMNLPWIDLLENTVMAPPFYDMGPIKVRLPQGKLKVALMLSKLNYGVETGALKETIRQLAGNKNIALAIKPHTRGMKFDFMDPSEIGAARDVSDIPSTAIIDWADIVLVTGSGIIFHALMKGKNCGLLKYCQSLETILEDGSALESFKTIDDLQNFIGRMLDGSLADASCATARKEEWIAQTLYAGNKGGEIAERYKAAILAN